MDPLSLVAAHMLNRRPPAKMSALDEDRYYSDDLITLWRRRLRLLGLMAPTAGLILLLFVQV